MKIADVMNRDVVVVSPRMPLKDVARYSSTVTSRALPVVDDDGTGAGRRLGRGHPREGARQGSETSIFGRALERETGQQAQRP